MNARHGNWGWSQKVREWRKTWVGRKCPFHLTKEAAWEEMLTRARSGVLRLNKRATDRAIHMASSVLTHCVPDPEQERPDHDLPESLADQLLG